VPARLLKQQDNPRGRSAFEKAPNCTSPPTANTSTADETAHLWGWNSDRDESCAFKDSNGDVIWYPDYEPASWLHTPACNSPPFGNESVVDSNLKVTGLRQHLKQHGCLQDALLIGADMRSHSGTPTGLNVQTSHLLNRFAAGVPNHLPDLCMVCPAGVGLGAGRQPVRLQG
jgi:hypothetical protein